MIALEYVSSKL